ncbi:hypothetical protein [Paenibacillus agaridevorans]|uniref:hypothetical protein n=1 Tax=Paenibacillus agaridevorans TaxID=171404 RepID=UPI0015E82A74|nr:hypothetical protein [Paenibacillus agaridevorans]
MKKGVSNEAEKTQIGFWVGSPARKGCKNIPSAFITTMGLEKAAKLFHRRF